MKIQPNHATGLTRVDALAAIVVIAVLAYQFLVPTHCGSKTKAMQYKCLSNLKEIGYGFAIWSNDNQLDCFPWEVSTNAGGTMEFIASGETFRHFQIASNELSTPKILVCPADNQRNRATHWTLFNKTNLSYFAGLTAERISLNAPGSPSTEFLSGDRQLIGGNVTNNVLTLLSNTPASWQKGIHGGEGNIVFADGSANRETTKQLRELLQKNTGATRLALP